MASFSDIISNITTAVENLTEADNSSSSTCSNFPVDTSVTSNSTGPDFYINAIFYPIILAVGSIGNILTLIVLGLDKQKSTIHVYLMCMAASNLCVIWLDFYTWIQLISPDLLRSGSTFWSTVNFQGVYLFWQQTCMQFSDWTLIVFSFERIFATTKPLEFRNFMTIRKAVYIELVVLFFAGLTMLSNIVIWYYALNHSPTPEVLYDDESRKREFITPVLLHWDNIQQTANVVITIGTWSFLTLINVFLIVILARYRKQRKTMVKTQTKNADSSQRNTTIVLLSCSGLYMFTMAFPLVCCIMLILSQPPSCLYFFPAKTQSYALPLSNLSMLTNYSLGFILYCVTWKRFRDRLKDLVGKLLFKKSSTKHPTHKKVTRQITAESQFSCNSSQQVSVKMVTNQPDPVNTTPAVPVVTKPLENAKDILTVFSDKLDEKDNAV